MTDNIEESIKLFMQKWDELRQGLTSKDALIATYGKRYAKVTDVSYGSRSVMAFVDLSNGDIYKPAGWSAPAKHVRGNVYSPKHGMEAVDGPYSIRYLN